MTGTEQRSKAEIVAAYGSQMTALLDKGAALWQLSQQALRDRSLYRQRDRDFADFLIDRELLIDEMGMSFIPVESAIFTHPYEIPPETPFEDYSDFLTPYARNHLNVKVNLGSRRGGVVELKTRLNDIRTSAPEKGEGDPERRIIDSLDAVKRLNVTARVNTSPIDLISRTVFEMIAVNNERGQAKGQKREELEKMGDKLAKERILRFVEEENIPRDVLITTIQEGGLQKLIVSVPGVGYREFLYNPNS